MKKLLTTGIVDPGKQQPLLGNSVYWIQLGIQEAMYALGQCLVGDGLVGNQGYVLFDCADNGTSVNNGKIMYQGEIYEFIGGNYSGYSNVPVVILDTINAGYDPITYSDGTTGNVHPDRRLKLADQVSGSGLFDWADVNYVLYPETTTVGGGGSAPAFQNSFAQQLPVIFRRDRNKLVTIQGIARKLTTATVAGQTIFTLPVGYRPVVSARNLQGSILYDTTTLVTDFINIATNGNVSISGLNAPGLISTAVDVYFTSISFYAD